MKTSARIGRSLFPIGLLALLLGATSGHAWADWYRGPALDPPTCDVVVEPTGSIQTAIANAANDQTICVRGGVYHEQIRIQPNKSGLTLIAYDDEMPIIDGNKRIPAELPLEETRALVELGGMGTVFDGFEVRHSSARGIDVAANNVTVRNSSVHDNWSSGIIVIGGNSTLSGVLIENNRIYNNLRRVKNAPVIYRGMRTIGGGPKDWTFDPDEMWDAPFWSGAETDLPESSLNGVSMTFDIDNRTSRVYVGSSRPSSTRTGEIGADHSKHGQFWYSGNDILFFEPSPIDKWTLYLNGEDFQLPAGSVIDAFQIENPVPSLCAACTPILMSFAGTVTIPIVDTTVITPTITPTAIGPSDLVRFSPTEVNSLGQITNGSFSLYRLGSDLGLPPDADIDALDHVSDGRLLISLGVDMTIGDSLAVDNADLIALDETIPGWSIFFKGNAIPFSPFGDDLMSAWLDAAGNIYVSGDPIGSTSLSFIKTRDSIARGNHVYNNFGEGLVAGRFSENITLEDNVTYDNFHANLYLNSTINPLVRRNLVYCTDDMTYWRKGSTASYSTAPGIQIRDEIFVSQSTPPSSGQVIVNNIVIGCSTIFGVSTQRPGGGLNNGLVANNTFANARGETDLGVFNILLDSGASYANSRFINNLILQDTTLGGVLRVQGGGVDFSTLTVANNLYSSPPSSTDWFNIDTGRLVGNPQLVDPTPPIPVAGAIPNPNDYQLTYGSPAFDAGQPLVEISADFFNQSRVATGDPDIGIHELPYKGTIIVEHVVQPSGQVFDFTAGFPPGGFQLGDGQQHNSGLLDVGVYNLSVAPVAGWTTTATCSDESLAEAVDLNPGETVTCTFTSTRETRLTVVNSVSPASDPQLFAFALSPGGSFQLGSDSHTIIVQPGVAHALTMAVPEGWQQSAAMCDNGDPPSAITLNAGDIVTCSFSHEKLGRIVIRKETLPEGTGQRFDFTADYNADGFRLGDGESDTSANLAAGIYAVAETLPPGWAQTNAVCDDGSTPDAIALGAGETVICTFTNSRTAPGPLATLYVTTPNSGTVRGLAYAPGDILAYNARVDFWSLYFDASDVGITKSLGDFVLMGDGTILMTFNARVKPRDAAGNLITVEIQDVARFVPASLGATTAGAFELYFDGSDVALSTSAEKIDALTWKAGGPLGTLLISTTGAAAVKNGGATVKAQDEDLLAFQPTSLGSTTAGVWSLAFDGSTLTGMGAEDVTGVWHDQTTGDLYLTITNNFNIKGVSGTNRTVLAVTPAPARNVSVYWDAASAGFPGLVDGLHIVR